MDLAPHIRELILLNECVILRGIGGFETTYKHAELDGNRNVLAPPTKRITFRPEWIKDNGVLENHLSRVLGVDSKQASVLIENYTQEFFITLKAEGQITLEGIGVFRFDERSILQFKELEATNYLADSFGLDVLEVVPEISAPVRTEAIELQPVVTVPRKFTGWYVVIGVLLLVVAVTFVIIVSENQNARLFGQPWQKTSSTDDDLLVLGRSDSVYTDPVIKTIEASLEERTQAKRALAPDVSNANEAQINYFLIAGSFKNIRNAELLRDQLERKGFQASIRETGVNFRVVIGQFTNRQSAVNELRRMRSQLDQSVWLLEEIN